MSSEIIRPQARLGRWNTVGCSMKFIVNAWHTGLLTNGSVGRLLRASIFEKFQVPCYSCTSTTVSLYQTDIFDSGIVRWLVRWHPRICNYFNSLWFKWEIPSFIAFSLRHFSTINLKHGLGLTNTAYSLALASEGKRMISIYGLSKLKSSSYFTGIQLMLGSLTPRPLDLFPSRHTSPLWAQN